MPYVNVPNDLSKIKTKLACNLTAFFGFCGPNFEQNARQDLFVLPSVFCFFCYITCWNGMTLLSLSWGRVGGSDVVFGSAAFMKSPILFAATCCIWDVAWV